MSYHIVVCGGIAPDPLQTLEPISTPNGPALKNEMMLPCVLDPWSSHALFEAAHLAKQNPESKLWLVSVGPKAKLQQLMTTTIAQKVAFEFIAVDGPAGAFTDANEVANALAEAIKAIPGLDMSKLMLFGGWESATRGAGSTMQMLAETLGIEDQFQGVDELTVSADGLRILERIEGGRHQVSLCAQPPLMLGWATGSLPEPPNNPQTGMANMRGVMPALQKAKPFKPSTDKINFKKVAPPSLRRETRIEKNMDVDTIATEIIAWIKE